jgi:hypothetical protein
VTTPDRARVEIFSSVPVALAAKVVVEVALKSPVGDSVEATLTMDVLVSV